MLRSIEIKPWFLRFVLYEHFSSSLSCPRNLWVTEVEEPQNRPRVYWGTEVSCAKYPGERKCTARNLSWGTEVHCANLSWGTEVHCANLSWGTEVHCAKLSWGTEVHCAKLSWGTEVQYRNYPGERKCTARNYPGERKCSTEIILGNGRRLRQKYPGERKTTATRLRRSCRAKSRPPTACCALPRPSLISIHITLSSAARTVGE